MNAKVCMQLNNYDRLMRAAERHYILGRRHNRRTWRQRATYLNREANARFDALLMRVERDAVTPDAAMMLAAD